MKLSQAPVGLLGALALKALGRNPTEFTEQLAATYESREFYDMAVLRGRVVDTPGATNVGDTAEVRVPAGEVWAVKWAGVILSAFSGAVAFPIRTSINAIWDPASAPVIPDVVGTVNAANDQLAGGAMLPLFLPSDGRLVATLRTDLGAVTCTLSLRVVYARYDG